VGNDINLHVGAPAYIRDHGAAPQRGDAFGPMLEYAALAEEGLFTAIFLGDVAGSPGSPALDGGPPEPITAFAAMARETTNVGLIATASTTFYDPYNLARLLGSLDQISDGRAGFNAVTSVGDIFALNYSRTSHPDRETRYRKADEFLDVVTGLWDNRELRTDPDGMTRFYSTPIDHKGEHYQVLGPLNVAPSRQGRPLIAQAGGSGPGIKVAAKHAEMVFTNANTLAHAATYRAELNLAVVEAGRPPASVPVFPGLIPYLDRTAKAAEERMHDLDAYVPFDVLAPFALAEFGIWYSFDSVDDPFPVEILPNPEDARNTLSGVFGNYVGLYTWVKERPGVTVREVTAQTVVRGGSHHRKFIGSYDEFADDLATWFETGDVDGFNLMFPAGSIAIREFVEEGVPRLIDRGLYRSTPDTRPLRERFSEVGSD
jgi:FMN-dependent oxidoreductase (nitrilotriacetate monooxygenase family)